MEIYNMQDLISIKLTMTSREIAELTGKRHDHVLRDIDSLIKELHPDLGAGFKSSAYKDSTGKTNRMYEMDKDSTYCLMAGYDANGRMRIIKRWQELEAQAALEGINWKQQRQIGKEVRVNFCGTLGKHGVNPTGYADCTNAIYKPIFGGTANDLKRQRGTDKLRDAMTTDELQVLGFTETLAKLDIVANNSRGNTECASVCGAAGNRVKTAMGGRSLPPPAATNSKAIPATQNNKGSKRVINITLKLSF